MPMNIPPLGIDISKLKFIACLLREGSKLCNRVFANNPDSFSQLSEWLMGQVVGHKHACLGASGTYGDTLTSYLYEAGHTRSTSSTRRPSGHTPGVISRAPRPSAWTPH
jgi:hypothetical protein